MADLMYLLLPIAMIGQLAISVTIVNRLHSLGYPRWMLKIGDCFVYVFTAGLPIAAALWTLQHPIANRTSTPTWLMLYLLACYFAIFVFIGTRIYQYTLVRTTRRLLSNHTDVIDLRKRMGHRPTNDAFTTFCAELPLNEILKISVREKTIRMPRLDPAVSGLRITHLSDLHMTGQLSKAFYEEIVAIANEAPADLVAITGDIVEKVPCLDWIADTLGKLDSKLGVFFVLGNHERRIPDEALVRNALTDCGLIDLGSSWQSVSHNDRPLVLGGNELPWYRPAADFSTSPAEIDGHRPLRILLTHSPDQIEWARENNCDLMLAGHTHGGQVRLPIIGPILAPSRLGTRFASGTFYREPTLMHVSRGVAGTRPLRLNCQPEIARLVLQTENE